MDSLKQMKLALISNIEFFLEGFKFYKTKINLIAEIYKFNLITPMGPIKLITKI